MSSDDVGMTYPDRSGIWKRIWIDSVGQRRERVMLVRNVGSPGATATDLRKATPRRLADFLAMSGLWVFMHEQPGGHDDPESL